MSKLITTDNLAKLSAGLDARYKSLINDSVSDMIGNSVDAAQATILVEVKKQVDAVKDMLGGKALVYLTQAEYDALSEEEKNDENIVYNITDSESTDHEHENLEFLDKITAINITIGNKTQVLDFNGNLNFSLEDIGVDNNHKHDEYYTEEEINNVVSNLEARISGKADTGHNHDDRYYTESEMNELLSNKAGKDHSHDEFNTFAIKSEMNSALEGKANKQHEHNEYATKLGLEEDLEIIEGSINEVSQNVTALDTTLRGLINNKADSEHSHDDKYYIRSEVDENISEAITNQNSELTAEINRVENMLGGKSIIYITQADYDALSESEKANELKTYFITDADDSHNHDDLYYTEDEVNTLLAGKANVSHGAHVEFDDTTAPKANGTASVGSSTKVARADHVHPIPDSVSSAGEANQVKNPLTIRLNSGTTEGTNQFVFNGSSAKTVNITPDSIGASVSGHNHNDLYYTEAEIDAKLEDVDQSIAGVTVDKIGAAPANHNHDHINTRGNVACETANNAPAVEGLSMSHAYDNGYPTNYGNVMTMSGAGDGQLLIGWPGTSGAHAPVFVRSKRDVPESNWSEWAQIYTTANKPTPEEIGAQRVNNTVEAVSVVNGVLQLTSNPRQKCTNMVSGTQINFPTVSNAEFLEVHLYFNAESDMSLALPDNCKWRVDPNLDAGTSYELVATWNTMNWLVNLMVYS